MEEKVDSSGRWGMRRREREKWGVMVMCREGRLGWLCEVGGGVCCCVEVRWSVVGG